MIDKKFAYKIFLNKNLTVKYYNGILSLSDIIDSISVSGQHPDWKPTMNIIHDIRDVVLDLEEKEIQELLQYVKEDKKLYGERKVAFITNRPNQVVFTFILTNIKNESLVNMNTFSTLNAAIEWVELPITDLEMIENCINKLKMQVKNS
ncbi:MAG: hypothetical protein Q7T92_00010 [Lutibacter sp.]|nr:hypothetical protein [Lutibacter sp.]